MEDKILRVITYFAVFSFPPSLEEIYLYLEDSIQKKQLQEDVDYMVTKKILVKQLLWINHQTIMCYTLAKRSYFFQVRVQREITSLQKLEKVSKYLRILSSIPQIRFVGLSGSLAMMNGNEDDDIDLFIITSADRIWTARFLSLIIAQIMGLRGKYNVDKVCLNMFFDESDMQILTHKQNEYIAHEIFQMKVYVNKYNLYEKFIMQNKWAYAFFPNIAQKKTYRIKTAIKKWKGRIIFDLIENLLKKIQLAKINKRKTTEIILEKQLWLIKEDFEKKIPLKLKRL